MIRSTRNLLTGTAAALALAATAAPAGAAGPIGSTPVPVLGGTVGWGLANEYDTRAPAPQRGTWLGHATNPGVATRGQSNGTAIASDGAITLGPDGAVVPGVTPESPRGADTVFTFAYGGVRGTFDPVARTGDVSSNGVVTFVQYPALGAGAPAPFKVVNPRIVLSGSGGAVYAGVEGANSGQGGGAGAFDPAAPLFTLDVSSAQVVAAGGGRFVVAGLVPTLAQGNVFGSSTSYTPGTSGPDRTPNTWGAFSLVIETQAPVVTGPVVVPEQAPRAQLAVLTRELTRTAFRKTRGPVRVKIRQRGEWKILGEGFVQGRLLTLILPQGTRLEGQFVLRRTSKSKTLPKSRVVTAMPLDVERPAKQSKKAKSAKSAK